MPIAEIAGLVRRIAREEGVNENEFLALVYQESRFNPCAKSGVGATWPGAVDAGDCGRSWRQSSYNIEQNLRGGARYYKQQLRCYNGNVAPGACRLQFRRRAMSTNMAASRPSRKRRAMSRNITQNWLPAFGGSDKSGIPLNFGGGETAYTGMRNSTLNAMGTTTATTESLSNVGSWYQQLARLQTGTIQDSWDHNSTARNANLEMMNNVIKLGTAMADLINSRNAITMSDLSSSSQSASKDKSEDRPGDTTGLCDSKRNLIWDPEQTSLHRETGNCFERAVDAATTIGAKS